LKSKGLKSQLNRAYSDLFPCILAFMTLFGVLFILDEINIIYYPTIHRITKGVHFELKIDIIVPIIILIGYWLSWVLMKRKFKLALLIFPMLLTYYFSNIRLALIFSIIFTVISGILSIQKKTLYFKWVLLILCGLEISAIIHWIILNPLGVDSFFIFFATLEQDLYYISSYLSPLLALLLLFVWIIKPITLLIMGNQELVLKDVKKTIIKTKTSKLLILSLAVCIAASFFPYMRFLNPKNLSIGVDIKAYLNYSERLEDNPLFIFEIRDRSLIYVVIILFKQIIGSSTMTAIRLLPIILNPLMVISSFYLTLELSRDHQIAAWASFFVSSGIKITVGMYSYFLANILGLSLINFSLFFLFRSFRLNKKRELLLACIFGSLLLFTHPWTFDQYYVATIIFTASIWLINKKSGKEKQNLTILATYLFILGLTEFLKSWVFKGYGAISATSTVVNKFAGLSEFWYNVIFSFRLLYGGFMSNPILLSLAFIGVYLRNKKDKAQLYINSLLSITSLVFLIGDITTKSRLFFNVPLGILSAIGLNKILSSDISKSLKKTIQFFITVYMTAYLFRSMSNLI